jgi:hypothetical protein
MKALINCSPTKPSVIGLQSSIIGGVGLDELISDLKSQYDYNVPFGCINFWPIGIPIILWTTLLVNANVNPFGNLKVLSEGLK